MSLFDGPLKKSRCTGNNCIFLDSPNIVVLRLFIATGATRRGTITLFTAILAARPALNYLPSPRSTSPKTPKNHPHHLPCVLS